MKKALLLILAVFLILTGGLHFYGQKEAVVKADLILVFGAPVKASGELSNTLKRRCDCAAAYLKDNPKAQAILLGGAVGKEKVTEARAMADYLIKIGINKSRLILEEKSQSTWTNLQNAKIIMENTVGLQPVMVCSSDYHMLRINLLAKRLDLDTHPLPATTPLKNYINNYPREIGALFKSFLFDR